MKNTVLGDRDSFYKCDISVVSIVAMVVVSHDIRGKNFPEVKIQN